MTTKKPKILFADEDEQAGPTTEPTVARLMQHDSGWSTLECRLDLQKMSDTAVENATSVVRRLPLTAAAKVAFVTACCAHLGVAFARKVTEDPQPLDDGKGEVMRLVVPPLRVLDEMQEYVDYVLESLGMSPEEGEALLTVMGVLFAAMLDETYDVRAATQRMRALASEDGSAEGEMPMPVVNTMPRPRGEQ